MEGRGPTDAAGGRSSALLRRSLRYDGRGTGRGARRSADAQARRALSQGIAGAAALRERIMRVDSAAKPIGVIEETIARLENSRAGAA